MAVTVNKEIKITSSLNYSETVIITFTPGGTQAIITVPQSPMIVSKEMLVKLADVLSTTACEIKHEDSNR